MAEESARFCCGKDSVSLFRSAASKVLNREHKHNKFQDSLFVLKACVGRLAFLDFLESIVLSPKLQPQDIRNVFPSDIKRSKSCL